MTLRQISVLACWVAILASFVLSFGTWLALGTLAGFGVLAVAMPLAVDGYMITTLTIWLSPEISPEVAWLAKTNLYGVGVVSVVAQAGYHGWLVGNGSPGAAVLAVAVGAFPPAVATWAVHLRARASQTPVLTAKDVAQLEDDLGVPVTLGSFSSVVPTFVYRLLDSNDALLYVGVTGSLNQRLKNHHAKSWWPEVADVHVDMFAARADGLAAERVAIASEQPRHNKKPGDSADYGGWTAGFTKQPAEPVVQTPLAPLPPAQTRTAVPHPVVEAKLVPAPTLDRPTAAKPAPHKVEESRSPSSGNGTDSHDVRRMLAEGCTTEQIAARLHVSKRTATRRIAAARADRRLVGVS